MSLFQKSVSGLIWSLGNTFSVQLINLLIQILLARVLEPEAFGVIALLQVFLTVGLYLTDGGMSSSLIRMKNPTHKDFSTVFITNILFGALIYLAVFFLAPVIASFYEKSEYSSIIRIYALSFVIGSFSATPKASIIKRMQFKKLAIIQLPSILISGLLGVYLALCGFGVYSLVYMTISNAFFNMIFYWRVSEWRPSLFFEKDLFWFHFNFGFKISITNVFNGVFDNIYNVLVGKIYGVTALGYYNRAEQYQLLPGRVLSAALEKVTYPMFSELQDDSKGLLRSYKTIMFSVLFWLSPVMIILSIIAEPIFLFLLTEKWLPLVPLFQILLIAGVFNPLQRFNLNILRTKGKPGLLLRLNVFKKILLLLIVLATYKYGLETMVWGQSISFVISFLVIEYYVGKNLLYSFQDFIGDLFPTVFLLIGWGISIYFLYTQISIVGTGVLNSFFFGLVSFGLYVGLAKLFRNQNLLEAKILLRKFLRK